MHNYSGSEISKPHPVQLNPIQLPGTTLSSGNVEREEHNTSSQVLPVITENQ